MKSLGIVILKDVVWFAVMEGENIEDANFITSDKVSYNYESTSLMVDFENIFIELINKYHPSIIGYKLHLEVDKQQIHYMHFPLGILDLICLKKNLSLTERTSAWISRNKDKKMKVFETQFDEINVKGYAKEAALIAWDALGG